MSLSLSANGISIRRGVIVHVTLYLWSSHPFLSLIGLSCHTSFLYFMSIPFLSSLKYCSPFVYMQYAGGQDKNTAVDRHTATYLVKGQNILVSK